MCCLGLIITINASAQKYAKSGDLKITEIMYDPPETPDTFEYFEVYNTTSNAINLGGYTLQGVVYTIPKGVVLASKGRILFCKDSIKLDAITKHSAHGWQWTSGGLSNSGESIGILDPSGKVVDTVLYGVKKPWPKNAAGNGPSLVLCDETKSEHGPWNWSTATNYIATVNGKAMRGNPGYGCSGNGKDTTPPVVVSVYTSTSHHIKIIFSKPISKSADTLKHYSGNAVKHADSAKLTVTLDTLTIYLGKSLKDGNYYTITIDSIRDTSGNLMIIPQTYRFLFNGMKKGIKVTEFMYNNPGTRNLEFIELYNYTTDTLPIGGLQFTKGITMVLPQKLVLPGHYFLIARDSLLFDSFYYKVSKMHAYQWDSGAKLINSGSPVHLKNTTGDYLDSFTYTNTYPWPPSANGGGSSVVRCNAFDTTFSWTASADFVDTLSGLKVYASPGKKCGSSYNPIRTINKQGRSYCGPVVLRAGAGNKGAIYRWNYDSSSTSDSIVAKGPGKYVVIIVNGAGGVVDSVTLNPFIVSAVIKDTACAGSKTYFYDKSNVPANAKRIWNLGDTTTSVQNPIRVYDSVGTKHIMLKLSDAYCSDSIMKDMVVAVCTGIEPIKNNVAELKIYPNPNSGIFDVSLSDSKEGISQLRIFDAFGRLVYSSKIVANANAQRINLENLPKGLYFISINSNTGVTSSKLILN